MTALEDLPVFELGFPGPLRDRLVAAVLDGSKTSTTGLLLDYQVCGDPMPVVGERSALLDSAEERIAVLETTAWSQVRLADVDLQHALDEGEGNRTVAEWRAGHTRFFESPEVREALGDPTFTVDDDTVVILQRFRLVDGP